ncbi:MAG: tRNA (adenosine(37)-N6)-dimethylallyltransferase MiaA [Bacteroidaceae bacterium]|nr:tRNA (adenosine(37)-N6)-dimethylallyltransferase MiaA [Bacteroidaceae bacterium]
MNTLFVLLGPTAVGKTELSLKIAEALGSPILNADSRQLYRDIPIGTAAPTAEQMQRVRHYFVGTLGLEEYYSAAAYEQQVMELLPTLFGETPGVLLSGGSMLYIDAVCRGIDDIPTVEEETRTLLRQRLAEEGLGRLCAELRLLDPEYYRKADLHNTQRIVHALEICYQTGRPYSSFLSQQTKQRPFRIIKIGLQRPREELFSRINQRALKMLENGFEQEARRVYPLRHLNSLNTVGYKEMFRYISGEWSLPQAIEKIQRNTRVYAKKQMTWFQRDADINWFRPDEEKEILDFVKQNSAD